MAFTQTEKLGVQGGLGIAGVLISGWGEAQKGVNEARRIRAQNRARIKQLKHQFQLNTQNLHNNNVEIKQNKLKNDVLIQESKLQSQDAFAQAFIGSGIKGKTLDVISANMQNEVSKAHNENKQQAQAASDRQFLGLMRSSDEIKATINNFEKFDFSAMESNMNMAMLNSAMQSASSMVGLM